MPKSQYKFRRSENWDSTLYPDILIFLLLPKIVSILPFQEFQKLLPNEERVPKKINKETHRHKKRGTPENRVKIGKE